MQIKPLTEEEKKQKLAELREKMAAKKAAKAKEEAKETLANEAIRRKAGKVRLHSPYLLPCSSHTTSLRACHALMCRPCACLRPGHQPNPGRNEAEGAAQGGRGQASRYV